MQTENDFFGKVVVAVSVLSSELRFLSNEATHRFLDPLLHYSDKDSESRSYTSLGRFLPLLQEFSCYKTRSKEVITLCIQQLSALGERDFSSVAMNSLYECLSQLLVCLLTADCIIKANNPLREHWAAYKASLNACSHSATTAAKVGVVDNDIAEIDRFLATIEQELLSGRIFTDCVQELSKINVSRKFLDGLVGAFQSTVADVDNPIIQSQYPGKIGLRVLAAGSLLVIHGIISRSVDKKLLRTFLDCCKAAPIAALWRNISGCPADIILQMIPEVGKHVDKKQLQTLQLAKDGILQVKLAFFEFFRQVQFFKNYR